MNILIVEDERVAARRLERLSREILGDRVGVVSIVESLEQSERFLDNHDIDLLLLDLNLNGADGFGLLAFASACPFETIVVSANTDQALRAFEYGVLDFVAKPFDKERLAKALSRVERGGIQALRRSPEQALKQLAVRRMGSIQIVPVDDVLYLKGAGDYVEIHLKNGEMELHGKSLESLEQVLPEHFLRIHKSYILDMRNAKQILVHGAGKYELELANGTRMPLSRTKYKEICASFTQLPV